MLYLIYGKDTYRSRQKLNEILSAFRSKRSGLGVFYFDEQSFDEGSFKELVKSQTLFEDKNAVVCENLLEDGGVAKFVENNLEEIAGSQNIFIFLEKEIEETLAEKIIACAHKAQKLEPLLGATLKKFIQKELETGGAKYSANNIDAIAGKCGSDLWCASKEVEKIILGGKVAGKEEVVAYNPFAISDAMGEKNKRKAWLVLQQARLAGVSDEEVFWKIVWQIKTLLLVKKTAEADSKNLEKDTGLHPFVVKKALSNIKNFAPGELEEMSFKALEFYHNARLSRADWEIGVEKLIVS